MNVIHIYRVSKRFRTSKRGIGCIRTTQIATRGRKSFSDSVDGVVRDNHLFTQEHQNRRKPNYTNAELVDMHLAYGAADCSGPAS